MSAAGVADGSERTLGGFLRLLEIGAEAAVRHPDVFDRIRAGELQALMVRAPAEYATEYDPVSLEMRSCPGWTESQLQAECEYVTRCAEREGGRSGQYFWIFPPPGGHY